MSSGLLERVRRQAGLSQETLAEGAGTSRTTLSAYERGRKSPNLSTLARLLRTAGYELSAEPLVEFREVELRHGRPIFVPNRLWRLPVEEALADVTLPLAVNWSRPGAVFRLRDRRERARCYEIVIREGVPADIQRIVDGALLVDAWHDLVLPHDVREAWQGVVEASAT